MASGRVAAHVNAVPGELLEHQRDGVLDLPHELCERHAGAQVVPDGDKRRATQRVEHCASVKARVLFGQGLPVPAVDVHENVARSLLQHRLRRGPVKDVHRGLRRRDPRVRDVKLGPVPRHPGAKRRAAARDRRAVVCHDVVRRFERGRGARAGGAPQAVRPLRGEYWRSRRRARGGGARGARARARARRPPRPRPARTTCGARARERERERERESPRPTHTHTHTHGREERETHARERETTMRETKTKAYILPGTCKLIITVNVQTFHSLSFFTHSHTPESTF